MPRYRHKPTETTAERYNQSSKELPEGVIFGPAGPYVITVHGVATPIAHGDYIVREPTKEPRYYPCKPEIFEAHYELVGEG